MPRVLSVNTVGSAGRGSSEVCTSTQCAFPSYCVRAESEATGQPAPLLDVGGEEAPSARAGRARAHVYILSTLDFHHSHVQRVLQTWLYIV